MTKQEALRKLWELDALIETTPHARVHQVLMVLAYRGAPLYQPEQPPKGSWLELLVESDYLRLEGDYLKITEAGMTYVTTQLTQEFVCAVEQTQKRPPDVIMH